MRLWSLQPESIIQRLKEGIPYHCDPSMSELLEDESFLKAYKWLTTQMETKTSKPPDKVTFPVWAWAKSNGKTKKPDKRTLMFNKYPKDYRIIELEVDESRILLSDFDLWHNVLNSFPILTDEEYDKEIYNLMSINEVEETWEQIFNITAVNDIQACFWEIRPEDVIKIY